MTSSYTGGTTRRLEPAELLETSPVATVQVCPRDGGGHEVHVANPAAEQLLGVKGSDPVPLDTITGFLGEEASALLTAVLDESVGMETTGAPGRSGPVRSTVFMPPAGRGDDPPVPGPLLFHTRAVGHGQAVIQMATCGGCIDLLAMLDRQKRFRAALLELSELAHTARNDEEFYRRLIEVAVKVVPGAQGGTVQVNLPGTTLFRFVAAVGYDLDGLQRHDLDQHGFFNEACNPEARIVTGFDPSDRGQEIADWLREVDRLSEIEVTVWAPVLSGGRPVAFLSLDNFENVGAVNEISVEMTTVLGRLIAELWRRRELESDVRREREAFRHLAMHDPLTGLANRRNLERSMHDFHRVAERAGHSWACSSSTSMTSRRSTTDWATRPVIIYSSASPTVFAG